MDEQLLRLLDEIEAEEQEPGGERPKDAEREVELIDEARTNAYKY